MEALSSDFTSLGKVKADQKLYKNIRFFLK